MKSILFVLLYFPFLLIGQQTFPTLTVTHLDGNSEIIPQDTKGKYTVIGVAFSQKAQKELESWIDPVYHNFISKSGMAAMVYDVNPRLLLMFTGAKKAVVEKAKKRLISEVQPEYKSNIGIWEGNFSEIKSSLSVTDKSTFYIFVLDKEGNIIHTEKGMHTKRKMETIGELVEE